MPDYTLQYVYQLSDFDTSGALIAPPDETGAKADATPPFDMALNTGVTAGQAIVDDNEALFHEQADPTQTLTSALTLDGITYAAGTRIFINYVVTTDDGLQGYGFTLGGNNNGSNTVTGFVTTEPMIAGQTYTFTSNQNVGRNPVPYDEFACFTAGTMIKTAKGERAVESLVAGDRVMTRDHGLQIIRWAGARTVAGIGAMAPITFDTGTLGCTTPLTVSPNHRMLIAGAMAQLVCGDQELLLSAKMLVNGRNVRRVPCGFVTYVHIMFDCHEIIWANDCPTESFYVGDHAINALDTVQAAEVLAIFPELRISPKKPALARAEGRKFEATVIAATL